MERKKRYTRKVRKERKNGRKKRKETHTIQKCATEGWFGEK